MNLETVPLRDLCEVRIGRTPSRSNQNFWGGPGVWLTISELNGGELRDSKEHISELAIRDVMPPPVPAGTLLFSFKLSIGKMGVSAVPLYTNEAIAALPIRDPKRLDREYLRYALMATSGSVQANHAVLGAVLNKAKVEALPIPVRPISEQRRIVDLLSRAENIVRMRREAEKKAKEIIPALFLDMFGDPGTNPKGWDVKRVGDIASYTRYGPRFPDRKYAETGAHILRTTDMDTSGNVRWEESPVLPVTQEEVSRFSLRPGTVVVTRTGATIGKIALFRGADRPCIAGAYLIELGTTDDVDPEYLLALLLSDYGQSALTSGSRAVAQPNLNAPTIRAIPLPIPPKAFQSSFAKRVSSFQALCRQQTGAIAVAEAAFQSLLAGIFSMDGRSDSRLSVHQPYSTA